MKAAQMNMYVGFWKRTGAFALDYVLILFYLAALTLIGLLLNSIGSTQWLFAERVRAQFAGFMLITLPVILYFALSEASSRRATWGKRKLVLQVTDYSVERIGIWRSLARTVLKFIPGELSHTLIWEITFSAGNSPAWVNYGFIAVYALIGLNLASLIFTKKHQTIYDSIAKTYVTTKMR